jgi:hypothetical protein
VEQDVPGERAEAVEARQRGQTEELKQAAQEKIEAGKVPGEDPEDQDPEDREELSRLGLAKHPGERPGVTIQPGGQPVQQLPGLDQKKEYTVDRPMSIGELEHAPEGIIHTPNASYEKGADGSLRVKDFTEAGRAKIREIEKREHERFGDYPGKGDPNSPKPPIQAGQPWFNPFTNEWGGGDGKPTFFDDYD